MKFNPNKYEVKHFVKSNAGWSCTVNGRDLYIDVQMDIGKQVHSFLKRIAWILK